MKSRRFFGTFRRRFAPLAVFVFAFVYGCSISGSKTDGKTKEIRAVNTSETATAPKGAAIPIDPNGPADTVRAFYKGLREKKFREAIFLTNLRPAIEGLTDMEMKDFALDFEAIAGDIPAEIEINGEIISGENATVTANLPNFESERNEVQQIKLRRENGVWIIQTVDEESEKRIKAEGKSYFYNLRIETHEKEAKKMLERISKAELAYSLQNGSVAEFPVLIQAGFLPDDVLTSESTGYNYAVNLSDDKRRYYATATPAVYGKSGKLSFLLELDGKGISHVSSKDTGGKVMKN